MPHQEQTEGDITLKSQGILGGKILLPPLMAQRSAGGLKYKSGFSISQVKQ